MKIFPGANTSYRGQGGDWAASGPFRGTLHTTEGDDAMGAINSFLSDGYWPHFTYAEENGVAVVYQHLDVENESGRALEHESGAYPETNRMCCIQIECVGRAATSHLWSLSYLQGLARLMRWIEATVGVHPISTVSWSGTDVGDAIRLSPDAWVKYSGWCGHAHVPNQIHWDPGAPPMVALLPPPVKVALNGKGTTVAAFLDAGTCWVAVRAIAAALGAVIDVNEAGVRFTVAGLTGNRAPMRIVGDVGYVAARALPCKAAYNHGILGLSL